MMPPKNKTTNFEKVRTGELVPGQIVEIRYDKDHLFKGFEGKEDKKQTGIRFKFKLDGYEYAHYSKWMKLSTHEKSNLYAKFISKLVENAKPDMRFEVDDLNLMRVKTTWSDNGDYQNIDAIYPEGKKIMVKLAEDVENADNEEEAHSEETPF